MKRSRQHLVVLIAIQVAANQSLAADALDGLSLEDLTKTEITSVSRKSQSLANVPAAAFVISAEDIRRSGAQNLPEALRMAPGIEVAQIDNGRYAVTARGFNGRFANKLQVLIDGRSIYFPTFSGVMWENDAIALEDIERIEVIRGQGAAVWGVNAVSGVINVISKHSRDQKGGVVAPTIGTQGKANLYLRYGAAIDEDTTWKLSAQGRYAEPSNFLASGAEAEDRLSNATVDARFDRKIGNGSDLALWANATNSSLGDALNIAFANTLPLTLQPVSIKQTNNSQTLGGRYRWLTAGGIESSVQTSFQASSLALDHFYKEDRTTFDLEYQGRYTFAKHDVSWGLSHRSTADSISAYPGILTFTPNEFTQRTSGVFMQDDWTLIPDTLQFGLGARWDDTNLGGSTFAPNATLMWTPNRSNTLWAKYAQAPRMPSRAEQTVSVFSSVVPPSPQMPMAVLIRNSNSGQSLGAEKMEGVELGYRSQITPSFNLDLSAYRSRYTDVVSGKTTSIDPVTLFPLAVIQNVSLYNGGSGWINGAEISADWLVLPAWRLQLSYSWTRIEMDDSSNRLVQSAGEVDEQGTPRHYGSLRSQWNVSSTQQFDAWVRGSAGFYALNAPFPNLVRVPGYVTLDLRYAHKVNNDLELAITGRNLVGQKRTEFISDYLPSIPIEISPSLLFSARLKF
jgi:iron complex outermembrane receptor protein